MRKIIEYTLVSVDGVFAEADISGFFEYRDDAYLRDGLGQLLSCDAMLMGRTTYEGFATIWPELTTHGPTGSMPSQSMCSRRSWKKPNGTTRPLFEAMWLLK